MNLATLPTSMAYFAMLLSVMFTGETKTVSVEPNKYLIAADAHKYAQDSIPVQPALMSLPANMEDTPRQECGTVAGPEAIAEMDRLRRYIDEHVDWFMSKKSTLQTISIPIRAHIIRRANGTGGLSIAAWTNALTTLNILYYDANIQFVECGPPNIIFDDLYFNMPQTLEIELHAEQGVPNVLNVYIPGGTLTSANGVSLCGYTYFPGSGHIQDLMVIKASCMTSGNTLAHEAGHYLGLYHTHGKVNCPTETDMTDELVNGSNCSTAGDDVCDTPADPGLSGVNCSVLLVDNNCVYTGNATDSNGQLFAPDPRNIMSYSRSECRDYFSPEQLARVHYFYTHFRNHLVCAYDSGTNDCANAADIGCGQTVSDTTGGNPQQLPQCGTLLNLAPGKWYRYNASMTGRVDATTCSSGTDFDTRIAVFSGSCDYLICEGISLSALNCRDSVIASTIAFNVVEGESYFIYVTGYANASGAFSLTLHCFDSNNTTCNSANTIVCGQTVTGITSGSPQQVSECSTPLNTAPGLWYRYTSNYNGPVIVNTCNNGTDFDTKIGIFTGSCGNLVCVAGNDDMPIGACTAFGTAARIVFDATQGTEYFIYITGYNHWSGSFYLTLTCHEASANTTCATADAIVCGQTVTGTTSGSPQQVPECGTPLNTAPGLWYRYTASQAEFVTVTTCNPGSDFDTKIAVFRGSCDTLTCIGGNDDDGASGCELFNANRFSKVNFIAATGTTYYIYVTGDNTHIGTFQLSLQCTSSTCYAPYSYELSHSNVTPTSVQLATTAAGSNFQFSYNVLGEPFYTTTFSPNPVVNISGLTPGTTYMYAVRRRCVNNNVLSSWSQPKSFTTPAYNITADPDSIYRTSYVGTTTIPVSSNCPLWTINGAPSWATVMPDSGSFNGSFSIQFEENYSPEPRSAVLTISGCGKSDTLHIIQADSSNYNPWRPMVTPESHTIIAMDSLRATLDGLPLEYGDVVGFFYEHNDSLHCSNYLKITGQADSIAVYGNDATLPDKNGFDPDEVFKAKIYKISTRQVFDAQAVFAPADTFISPYTTTHSNAYGVGGLSLLTRITAISAIRPQAEFDSDTHCGTVPFSTIRFYDRSSNEPENWYWDFGNGASSTEQNPVATYTEPGFYTVRLIAGNEAGRDTVEISNYVTIMDDLSITLLPGDTICAGETVFMRAEGVEIFYWLLNDTIIEAGTDFVMSTPFTEPGDHYSLVVGMTNSCYSSWRDLVIHARQVPVVSLDVSADTICRQGALVLTASGADTYLWHGEGLAASTDSMITAMPDTSGTIAYTVAGIVNGCTSAEETKTVWVQPRIPITATADLFDLCLGDTVTLRAMGADTVVWTGPDLLSSSGEQVHASPQQRGTFTYWASGDVSGCPAVSDSVSINVSSDTLSATITVDGCPGPDLVFTATVTNGGDAPDIVWYRNGQPVWTGAEYTLAGAQNGTEVYCRATPVNLPPCTTPSQAQSDTILVTCILSGGVVQTLPDLQAWSIHPNPNDGSFFMSLSVTEPMSGWIRVLDMLGRPVWNEEVRWSAGNQLHHIELPEVVPGLYWVVLEGHGQVMRKGVVLR